MITDGQGHFKLAGNKWDNIAMLIDKWHKKFPQDSIRLKQDIKQARDDYKHDRRERPMRMGLMIDPRLMYYIQRFYPDFLSSNQDLRTFSEKFPQFVIDQGVMPAKRTK